MATDISGFGLQVVLFASRTFPSGISITQFADDADPLDQESIQIADKAMGLNGDLVKWSKANPYTPVLNIIPNSIDDTNLAALFEANRPSRGKIPAGDVLTMVILYPQGDQLVLSGGLMTDGMPVPSVASAGRMKTKSYAFAFETATRSL